MTAYHSSASKLKAREETIYELYKKLFGRNKLPKSKQYWTLCAQCATKSGEVLEGSELDHALKTKFITINQFHGVDSDESIIKINKKLKACTWYNNWLIYAILSCADFNPGILNFDSVNESAIALRELGDILKILTDKKIRNTMVVTNVITRNRGVQHDPDEISDTLSKNKFVGYAMNSGGWICYPYTYTYNGATNRTEMTTLIFYHK